tara:strand:- start:633 stop:929 length:297 start_codon:yes stop_codon:yes gene_type:complete
MAGVSSFVTGRKSSIGTSAVQLTATSIHASRGVQIVADSTNSVKVYVGISTVTADSIDATDGFPLSAGESVVIPVIDPSIIYVRAVSGTTSKVFFVTV